MEELLCAGDVKNYSILNLRRPKFWDGGSLLEGEAAEAIKVILLIKLGIITLLVTTVKFVQEYKNFNLKNIVYILLGH